MAMVTFRKVAGPRRKNMVGLMADLPAAGNSSMAQDRVPSQVRIRHTAAALLVIKAAAIRAARS